MRRTKAEAAETREKLLDTAELVFAEQGVGRTTLQDIASAAGVTRGAIYWHFKNKYELLDAMIQRLVEPFDAYRGQLQQQWPQQPLQQMRMTAIGMLQLVGQDPHWRALFTIIFLKCEYTGEADRIRQHYVAIRNRCFAEVIVALSEPSRDTEQLAQIDKQQLTFALFSYVDGLIYNWLIEPAFYDVPAQAEKFVDQFLVAALKR